MPTPASPSRTHVSRRIAYASRTLRPQAALQLLARVLAWLEVCVCVPPACRRS
jgi:hypothetical protein